MAYLTDEFIAVNFRHPNINHKHIGLPLVQNRKSFVCALRQSDLRFGLVQNGRSCGIVMLSAIVRLVPIPIGMQIEAAKAYHQNFRLISIVLVSAGRCGRSNKLSQKALRNACIMMGVQGPRFRRFTGRCARLGPGRTRSPRFAIPCRRPKSKSVN
jgi:hypothetical protein